MFNIPAAATVVMNSNRATARAALSSGSAKPESNPPSALKMFWVAMGIGFLIVFSFTAVLLAGVRLSSRNQEEARCQTREETKKAANDFINRGFCTVNVSLSNPKNSKGTWTVTASNWKEHGIAAEMKGK